MINQLKLQLTHLRYNKTDYWVLNIQYLIKKTDQSALLEKSQCKEGAHQNFFLRFVDELDKQLVKHAYTTTFIRQHLFKTTSFESVQAISQTIVPLSPKWKKTCLKQPCKTLSSEEAGSCA